MINATLDGGVQLYYNTEYFILFYFIYLFYLLLLQYLYLLSAAWVINATLDGGVWLGVRGSAGCWGCCEHVVRGPLTSPSHVTHARDPCPCGLLGLLRARGARSVLVTRSRDPVT